MKKKNIIILAVVCIIFGIVLMTVLIGDKKLDLNDERVGELYEYLGEVDVYHCGGLNTYSDNVVTKSDINNTNLLCMAYYNLDGEKLKTDKVSSNGTNDSNVKVCKIGENATLTANEETGECNFVTVSKTDLNKSFHSIYGEDISDYETFYITNDDACYLEGDTYYCGAAETFTYSLAPEADVYRLLNKATQTHSGDIIIYDYYLKISDNKCYLSATTGEMDEDCTTALGKFKNGFDNASEDEKSDFMRKYAKLYKHTFDKDNEEYHWIKSEQK